MKLIKRSRRLCNLKARRRLHPNVPSMSKMNKRFFIAGNK